MTAKEMFEELGYKIAVKDDEVLMYSQELGNGTKFIYFRLIYKAISEYHLGYGGYVLYDSNSKVQITFTAIEHKAITQQMKELGWLDD